MSARRDSPDGPEINVGLLVIAVVAAAMFMLGALAVC